MKIRLFSMMLIAFIFTGCDKTVTQIDSYIKISDKEFAIDENGDTLFIYVNSNIDWTISNIPNWCVVNMFKDSKKPMFEIIIASNGNSDDRDAVIEIGNDLLKEKLHIIQKGKPNVNEINWYTFPVNSINSVEYILGENQVERLYQVNATNLFINSSIKNKIYLGNLINKYQIGFNLTDYSFYDYNPITVGSFVDGKAFIETYVPSLQSMNTIANEILSSVLDQNNHSIHSNIPMSFSSYRELNLLSKGNLDINFDEIISGKSYLEKEMEFQNGLIYSYCMESFHIVMDYPQELIKEQITNIELLKEMAYVKSVVYGKTAFLVIETNDDPKIVNSIIQKITTNKKVSDDEYKVIRNLKAYHLYFNNDNVIQVLEDSSENVIMEYANGMIKLPIIPLSFSVQSYFDHSMSDLNLNFTLK